MELNELAYDLSPALIAAVPCADRSASRLMVVKRKTEEIVHSRFSALGGFLDAGDLLVLNDTKVFPARLRGRKESGGKAEILLVEPFDERQGFWIALIEASKPPHPGSRIFFSCGVAAEVIGEMGRGKYGIRFHHEGNFSDLLEKIGEPPVPPYVQRKRDVAALDRERYQTVYASRPGAVAAPTAGFHFTPELLEALESRGIEKCFLTLHVGPGTFQPVREERVENHRMEGERYAIAGEAAEKINRTKAGGRRVIAVGSTTTRALEWSAARAGRVGADKGITRLFIHPGYSFRVIDALVTNFHLPASTPLLLVAAFAGSDLLRRAYREAIRREYRFYSYGDAMLVI
jgi:S-adenosylmethionine:tRNA ribosyltransferase-isomerase